MKADFQQSTFFGACLSPQQLHKRATSHLPKLNEEGEIDRLILDLMGSGIALGEIARQVQEKFPGRFASRQEAMARVGELSLKYSR